MCCEEGEHSDWAGEYSRSHNVNPGRTIVIGTEQGLYCRASSLPQVQQALPRVCMRAQAGAEAPARVKSGCFS